MNYLRQPLMNPFVTLSSTKNQINNSIQFLNKDLTVAVCHFVAAVQGHDNFKT